MIMYVKTANKGALNLRAKPNGSVLAQIPNGTQLEVQSDGEWSTTEYNGKKGYIKTEFLSTTQETNITKAELREVYNSLQQTLKIIEKILK